MDVNLSYVDKRRRYFYEHIKFVENERKTNSKMDNEIREWQSEIDAIVKSNNSNKEELLTNLLVENEDLQYYLMGVKFIDSTLVRTYGDANDISGVASFLNHRLRKKYGIGEEDAIIVENKASFGNSKCLTPTQYNQSRRNGCLQAVVSFYGKDPDQEFVENTNCPILSLDFKPQSKLQKIVNILGRTPWYSDIIRIMEKLIMENPLYFMKNSKINISTYKELFENLLFLTDSYRYRNPLLVIMHLAREKEYRHPKHGESLLEYEKRIIKKIEEVVNHPMRIKELDAYPYSEKDRKRYARSPGAYQKKNNSGKTIMDVLNETNTENHLFFRNADNSITFSKFLTEKFCIPEKNLYFTQRCDDFSDVALGVVALTPRAFEAYTPCELTRKDIKKQIKKIQEYLKDNPPTYKSTNLLDKKVSNQRQTRNRRYVNNLCEEKYSNFIIDNLQDKSNVSEKEQKKKKHEQYQYLISNLL